MRSRFLSMHDLEIPIPSPPKRRRLLVRFSGVALIGFAVSALVLHLGLEAGLRPWISRLIALLCAMNVTFLINGRFVFKALTRRTFMAQWLAYMANSAFGNFCNYWIFVTLESTHRPFIGDPYVALFAGSIAAWAINFTGARFLVFGGAARNVVGRMARLNRRGLPVAPGPGEPESSHR
ncbi:MAG TPA: GtrA family protein [Caulobacteraceae bacterium]|nr:GtrA family protein [Caulobacteraceae bacterium]